jgi:hypothetical protein
MHHASGNILLGDGSVQQTSSGNLSANWLTTPQGNTSPTNAPAHLLFP